MAQETFGDAEWMAVNGSRPEMKLDEAGDPDESNDNEASVGRRKGRNGELL
jgi:hypothetical protein